MKSIKEKAEEYENNIGSQDYCWLDVRESFEAGANYVLESIENLTDNQNWCAFPKQSHKELKELVIKLKGK